ncbi:hypothetical protein ASPFODRAFT_36263 [Aspergillus luchuensis CBS 106.47]|uniref:PPPDE domain-containing protein n=1 Tax=Aspergillus luchuensis (strain CBS 106.47) TaxID=1137211 RepID=A0A1M3T7K7_ASPLC|nr:hypothetical protein ASPFODRAFT_36263 [Aspergillus luchuensis CBS 106.47]
MWFNLTTNQKAFALASLLLTPGALAAAIPPREINSELTTPSYVAGVPINTHVPTTGADESLTSDPEVGVTCPIQSQTCDKDGNPKSIWEIIASGQPNAAPRSVDEDPSLTERDDGTPKYIWETLTGADGSPTSDPEVGVTCPIQSQTCDKDGNPKSIWEIIASGQPNAAPRSVDEDPSLTERDDDAESITGPHGYQPSTSVDEASSLTERDDIDANDITSDLQEEDTLSGPSDDDVAPSKTTRQPSTEVKRAAKVTGDAKYKKLKEALGKTPEVGQGYAIKIRSERARIAGKKAPDHYLIAAGYVTERKEGGVTYLKFESGCWDIQLDGKKIVFTDRGASSWYEWSETKMEVLGKIRSGVDNTEVERYGEQIAAKMNKKGYNTLFNNCRDFVLKLYAEIKA